MDVRESIEGAPTGPPIEVHLGVELPRQGRFSLAFVAAIVAHALFVLLFLSIGRLNFRGASADRELVPRPPTPPVRVVFYETKHEKPAEPPPETRVASDVATRARSEVKPLVLAPTREPAAVGESHEKRPEVAERKAEQAKPQPAPQAPTQPAAVPGALTPELLDLARRNARAPDEGISPTRTLTSPSLAQGADPGEAPPSEHGFGAGALDSVIHRQGFGNTTSGVTDTGGLEFDVKDFEWGPYAKKIYAIVDRNWKSVIPLAARMPGVTGKVKVRFRIQKNGKVQGLELLLACGRGSLDQAALASITLSDPLPPLPPEFMHDDVGVTFAYYYNLPMGEDRE